MLTRLTVVWWILCLGVIFAGLLKAHPDLVTSFTQVLHNPVMDLTEPFPDCRVAHEAGFYDIPRSSPAYSPDQDGDGDGLACEPYHGW
ncbi:hypothetical protein QO010_003662 [Caulobacter ginsengisoli]|uniref:Excalibur calcium-binding domain-containing protein n=1 Tax=Caulobacter ginsengisoli TaxID=400775 RepID=A0ABU0IWX8_9CAUL|nr:excalibur calcium-binding domain-containing protein [Caulobacter ginsengisoli]MDQ0465870.1 hypothetical protein [Caulobacter ginsengisoli]